MTDTYQFDPNDPYALDTDQIQKDAAKKGGLKVTYHNIPDGETTSTWRILPWTKRRTFFRKIMKHWNVPGYKGAVTCPKSFFEEEGSDVKFPCALCDESYKLNKSKDPVDSALAKTLRSTSNYYVNAFNVDDPEKTVGVLNIPYAVYKQLFDWLSIAGYSDFTHPFRGRNVSIKSTIVEGAKVPGTSNKNKRDFTITASLQVAPIDEAIMEKIWDLDSIMGIPTLEFTQACLQRVVTGDETAGKELVHGTGYRQLTDGSENSEFFPGVNTDDSSAPPQTAPPTTTHTTVNTAPPTTTHTTVNTAPTNASVSSPVQAAVNVGSPKPAFASVATTSAIVGTQPPVKVVPVADLVNGTKPCFGIAFDGDAKICLKCPLVDDCEVAVLKAARAAKNNPPAATPVADEGDLAAQMMAALGSK
jgi:hypothetical protein